VEVLDTRHPARVRVRAEVAPCLQSAEGLGDDGEIGVVAHALPDVLRAQVDGEAPLRADERQRDVAVQGRPGAVR